MASSIGLAASIDVVSSPKISLDYSVIYPFSIIITILFFQLLPLFSKIDFSKENELTLKMCERKIR
jgi:uncharacterized transporter YbjL